MSELDTTDIARPDARLELPGHPPRPASIEVIFQPRATRLARAIIVMLVAVTVAPVVFFLPPHLLWPVVTLAIGAYLARRFWIGEYFVSAFVGECPRCENPLELKPGRAIRARETLECFHCHRHPELVLDAPGT